MTQHPIDTLQTLVSQGRIKGWGMEYRGGEYLVHIDYRDGDLPLLAMGKNSDLGDAVRDAVGKLPKGDKA